MSSRREFMQVLGAAAVAGAQLPGCSTRRGAAAAEALYDVPRFGQCSLLHITDTHAQLNPVYFREPSVNLGVGEQRGRWPHRVGLKLRTLP